MTLPETFANPEEKSLSTLPDKEDIWLRSYPENYRDLELLIRDVLGASTKQRYGETFQYRLRGQDTLTLGNLSDWIWMKVFQDLFRNPQHINRFVGDFPITKLESLRFIEEIQELYTSSLDVQVQQFLQEHPSISSVLIRAYPYLEQFFEKDFKLQFEVVRDPEVEKFEQLMAYIVTRLPVDEAMDRLDQFDFVWFLDQVDQLEGKFELQSAIYMTFDWTDYLGVAEGLQANPEMKDLAEACYRSAASRAYYAAFHLALEEAVKEGYIKKSSGDDHLGVQRYFSSAPSGEIIKRKIGTELDRLKDLRGKADYANVLDRPANSLAAHAIDMAKRIITYLGNI